MAALWFRTGSTMIFDTFRPSKRFKAVMAERMQSERFTGIVVNDFRGHRGRDGGWTALHPVWRSDMDGGRQEFVFVVMCAADSEDVAKGNAGDVQAMRRLERRSVAAVASCWPPCSASRRARFSP